MNQQGWQLKWVFMIALLFTISSCYQFQQTQITQIDRNIALNKQYPVEGVLIKFRNQGSATSVYQHIVTSDMQAKIARINFRKDKNTKDHQCYSFKRQSFTHDGISHFVYIVDLKSMTLSGEVTSIYIKTTYINRYKNLPQKISLQEDQKLLFEDYRHFYSPYSVKLQTTSYKLQRIISFPQYAQKSGLTGVNVKSVQIVAPFNSKTHSIHGINNLPQMVFSEVQKIIEISHWGNIAITEFYKLKNVGPQLSGQFSRKLFNPEQNSAKNAYVGSQTILPYETWGLYYRDQVGNISTSKAIRDEYTKQVQFGIVPRFFLVGGWKSNFEIGYNLDTSKGFLMQENSHFETRKLKSIYAFSDILTEKYSIKVILPEGSKQAKIRIGSDIIDSNSVEKGLSFSYLDFEGRPSFEVQNLDDLQIDRIIDIEYQMDNILIFKKLAIVFGALFSVMLVGILVNRIKLQAFEDKKVKQN